MKPEQIKIVQDTFKKVAPLGDAVAEIFYAKLFAIDPDLRPMFKGDMAEQGRKLMKMLTIAVHGLHRLEDLVPAVQDLGRRHVGYGVVPAHYATVGAALIWTLEQGLGEDFTPEACEAWVAAYKVLSETMMSAGDAMAA